MKAENEKEEKKQFRKKGNKSPLITRESVGAVGVLFTLLCFLILLTGRKIFGDLGYALQTFLLGVFGFASYFLLPVLFCVFVASFIEKKFLRKKSVFVCVIAVGLISLLLHTILTYSWGMDGYVKHCFDAPTSGVGKSTVAGVLGGSIVFLLSKLITKVGAIVLLSALSLLFCYATAKVWMGRKIFERVRREKEDKPQEETEPYRPQEYAVPQQQYPQPQPQYTSQPTPQYVPVADYSQRPGVVLSDNQKAGETSGFSPFAYPPQQREERPEADFNAKEFLFGGNSADNYRKNLIFDDNANVNKRPPVDPNQPIFGGNSYTQSYERGFKERETVNDYSTRYQQEPVVENYREEKVEEPTPDFGFGRREEVVEPTPDFGFGRREEVEEPTPDFGFGRREEVVEEPTIREERRDSLDFRNIFSADNPNMFSPAEEERGPMRGFTESDRGEIRDTNRSLFDEEERDFVQEERRREPDTFAREIPRREVVEPTPPKVEKPVPPQPKKPKVMAPYKSAPIHFFDCKDLDPDSNTDEVEENKQTILTTLEGFKVTDATIASVTCGPTVTRYNVAIPRTISPKKVVALDQEIAISLYAANGVNIYANFEEGAVSIEVPNKRRQFVQLGCMLTGDKFVNSKPNSLMFSMGKDVANRKIYGDIRKMTHLLVAGASGSGKSVFLRCLIISLIYKYSPADLRLMLIDPKKTEFVIYDHLPHLIVDEIISDTSKVIQSLNWAIGEMNRRYTLFEKKSRGGTYVVNIDEYNANLVEGEEKLAKIVIIVDELADLMISAKKDIEERIQNITQKSRAAGIHMILATQRPSTDVITGVIKSNLKTRIAFSVTAEVDSRVILDATGAQKLLGKGDMLYTDEGNAVPVRLQSASIESEDAQKVVSYIKQNNECDFDEDATAYINNTRSQGGMPMDSGNDESVDPVYIEAVRYVILSGSASISMIQRKCSVGYNKAGRIIEWMEDMGYISSFDGSKARKVLITPEQFESLYGPLT